MLLTQRESLGLHTERGEDIILYFDIAYRIYGIFAISPIMTL